MRYVIQYITECDFCDRVIDDDDAIELDDGSLMCSVCIRKRHITLHDREFDYEY